MLVATSQKPHYNLLVQRARFGVLQETQKTLDIDNWENKRGPHFWEMQQEEKKAWKHCLFWGTAIPSGTTKVPTTDPFQQGEWYQVVESEHKLTVQLAKKTEGKWSKQELPYLEEHCCPLDLRAGF